MIQRWALGLAVGLPLWLLVVMQLDWAPLGTVDVWCNGSTNDAECWFTNRSAFEGRACARGRFVAKEGGAAVESLPVCSGRLEPGATRVVRSPWVKGRPIDVCSRTTRSAELEITGHSVTGGRDAERELSWKACKFELEVL